MAGSLRKIWPWKETVASIIDRHGEIIPTVELNYLPSAWTGEVFLALGLALAGFAIVIALDRLTESK
jgi:putative membrane protein